MPIEDVLSRFLFSHEDIRGVHVNMPDTVTDICRQHHYPPSVSQALSECLIASALMASCVKFHGDITVQLHSEGTLKMLVAKCSDQLHLRGLAQWDEFADTDQLAADFSAGSLVITFTFHDGAEPMQSIVELNGQSVAQVLEHYFLQSEQLPTLIQISVSDGQAKGLLLQRMPSAKQDNQLWSQLRAVLDGAGEAGLLADAQATLMGLFSQYDIQLFPAEPVKFQCHCTHARMENAVCTLGVEEVEEILSEHSVVTITCEYCNAEYEFTAAQVQALLSK